MSKKISAISPTRQENYPEWYQQVIREAELAEASPVRGCMVIRPWGWSIWESMKEHLDHRFKETGHENAYFPLLIPLEYLQKEANHIDGFAKECAVVTHHRLEQDEDGVLKPAGELEQPFIIRPTSETIIGEVYRGWIESWRDLPLKINQWANVMRWEMRTRLFLRTAEFLWQEGHTVHATSEEAMEETRMILDLYADFAEKVMAMPVVTGAKSEAERFPGAVETFSIEAMMQDRKALQAGTSHFLGQNFSKSANIQFVDKDEKRKYGWTTSWGVSTRLIGGLVMTHADDDGLRVPPRLAPAHIVILPITFKAENPSAIEEWVDSLAKDLSKKMYHGVPVRVEVDRRDLRGGEKNWSWIKKGAPIRLEVGPRDFENKSVMVARRDQSPKEKQSIPRHLFVENIEKILEKIQDGMFAKAKKYQDENTKRIDTQDDFYSFFKGDSGEIHGGFALTHFNGNSELEITGICGSGIIEVLGEMYLSGILTSDGIINGALSEKNKRIEKNGRTYT